VNKTILMLALLCLSGCATVAPLKERTLSGILRNMSEIPGNSGQVLLVVGENPSSSGARVYPLEKVNGQWQPVYRPVDASAGANGFALPGEKREGDGKTPSGIYPLEFAFGYASSIDTKMVYRQATEEDIWVDDPASPDYNQWVRKGETRAKSFEEMRRSDGLYKYGIIIGYNRNPVVKSFGSAIFFHVWKGEGRPTAGCVAMSEEDIAALLRWLDASQKPVAVIGAEEALK
jgi:L,D-peptidoglycan transpeptidase YkuD (ErfK/YbiS/YcfS/YnhG family)